MNAVSCFAMGGAAGFQSTDTKITTVAMFLYPPILMRILGNRIKNTGWKHQDANKCVG